MGLLSFEHTKIDLDYLPKLHEYKLIIFLFVIVIKLLI